MQIWLTILVSCPAPAGTRSRTSRAYASMTGLASRNAPFRPPTMTVSAPFSAPAWPPETGASRNRHPRSLAAASSSLARVADAVVWSTKMAPLPIP